MVRSSVLLPEPEPPRITTVSPWAPPGIAGPWPHDEYLEDGGDREVQANIGPEGEVRGLELEDTVMVYDTIDGRTLIEPSNRVCLYSPRFAAVRKVASVLENLVEGYLFGDLESMATEIEPKEIGACGYPIVMAVLSGSELLRGNNQRRGPG